MMRVNRHIEFAHWLRWPFAVGWVLMLVLWSMVLATPLFFGEADFLSWVIWGSYVLILVISPWLFLWPRRPWYRRLSEHNPLPWQAWAIAGAACGFLNTSVLEIALVLGDILVHGPTINQSQLAPFPLASRLAGSGLLAVVWGSIWSTWFDQGRCLSRYYRLLAAVLLGGIFSLVIFLGAQQIAQEALNSTHRVVPAFMAARSTIVSIILWAMGSSTLLLFSVRAWYRYHQNHCLACGYDRRGSSSPACPECGEE